MFVGQSKAWWPVVLSHYDEQGNVVENTIRVLFTRKTEQEMDAYSNSLVERLEQIKDLVVEDAGEAPTDPGLLRDWLDAREQREKKLRAEAVKQQEQEALEELLRNIHDWNGFVDEAGKPVPFSVERLRAVTSYRPERQRFSEAWVACSRRAPTKN